MMNLYSCIKLIQHITQSMWGVKVWAMFVKRVELKSHLMMRVQYRDHYILWKKHVKYDLNSFMHIIPNVEHGHTFFACSWTHHTAVINVLKRIRFDLIRDVIFFPRWRSFWALCDCNQKRDCWTHDGTLWVYFVCLSVFIFWHYEMFSCFHLARISVFLI